MCPAKMHAAEVDTDASLVRRLLAAQFPEWSDLPIERIRSGGTDNAICRSPLRSQAYLLTRAAPPTGRGARRA